MSITRNLSSKLRSKYIEVTETNINEVISSKTKSIDKRDLEYFTVEGGELCTSLTPILFISLDGIH